MSADAYEERAVPVHPSQSRRAMHNYGAAGVPILGNGMSGGLYVIVIAVPLGAPTPDWTQAPEAPRRSYPVFEQSRLLRIALALAVAAAVCGAGYLIVRSAGSAESLWQQAKEARLPWQATPEVTAAPAPTATPEQGGFRWPWESAADGMQAAADTAESVQSTVTVGAGAVLAVLVLLIVLALVRKRR